MLGSWIHRAVAVTGPPATGKATSSEALVAALNGRDCVSAAPWIVPTEAFPLDNGQLDRLGLRARKGAPRTFEFDGSGPCLTAAATRAARSALPCSTTRCPRSSGVVSAAIWFMRLSILRPQSEEDPRRARTRAPARPWGRGVGRARTSRGRGRITLPRWARGTPVRGPSGVLPRAPIPGSESSLFPEKAKPVLLDMSQREGSQDPLGVGFLGPCKCLGND